MNNAEEWESQDEATFVGERTPFVHYTGMEERSSAAAISIVRENVKPSEKRKTLGVILDLQLSDHIVKAASIPWFELVPLLMVQRHLVARATSCHQA